MNSLSELTGGRYRIALEKSWHHERPEIRSPDRIWYEQIPCRGGAFIGLYSLNPFILQLFTPRVGNARRVWEAIQGFPKVRADFHFDGEAVLYFTLDALHTVAEIAGARKKRRLSPEARAKLSELGKAFRFKPQNHGVETKKTAQKRAIGAG